MEDDARCTTIQSKNHGSSLGRIKHNSTKSDAEEVTKEYVLCLTPDLSMKLKPTYHVPQKDQLKEIHIMTTLNIQVGNKCRSPTKDQLVL